jgi:hypothetical protein
MLKTTREQRESILRKWMQDNQGMTYREFRKKAMGTIGCDGAVVVPWCNMFVCIETDGYAHT